MAAIDPQINERHSRRRPLRTHLARVRRRVRLCLAAQASLLVLMILCATGTLWVLAAKLLGLWHYPVLVGEALAAGLIVCLLMALVWRLPDSLLACSLDARLGLHDRVTTALWLSRAAAVAAQPLPSAAIADGIAHLRQASAAAAYPLPDRTRLRRPALCAVLLGLALIAPLPPWLLPRTERQERQQVRVFAGQITPVARLLSNEADRSDDPVAKELAAKLKRLQQRMKSGQLNRKRATLAVSDLQRDLRRLAERSAHQGSPEQARRAAENLQRQAAAQLRQQAEALQQAALRGGNQAAANQAAQVTRQVQHNPSPDASQKACQQLSQLAGQLGQQGARQALQTTGQTLQMAAALAQSDPRQSSAQVAQLAQQAASQLSQATPAQAQQMAQRLDRLAQQLQQAGMTPQAQASRQAAQACMQGQAQSAARAMQQCAQASRSAANQGQAGQMAQDAARSLGQCVAQMNSSMSAVSQQTGMGVGPEDGPQKGYPRNAAASLYAPRQTPLAATPTQVRTSPSNQPSNVIADQVRGAPAPATPSRVPYYEVIGEYTRAAEDALSRDEVPVSQRGTVRDYFEALSGGGSAGGGPSNQPQQGASTP